MTTQNEMPEWLEEERLRQGAADWMMPCEFPCDAIKLLLAHVRELREALDVVTEKRCACSHTQGLCVHCQYQQLLDREEPPEVS